MNQPPAKAHLSARDCWQAIRDRRGVIFLSSCLAFIVAVAAVTAFRPFFFPPKKYPARVLMQVGGSLAPIIENGFSIDCIFPAPTTGDPLSTEFAIITASGTLSRVVAKLDLVDRWKLGSPDEARVRLARMIDVSEERGTDLIEIKVLSTDKDEAAELANAVAEAYIDRRKEIEAERVSQGFHMLGEIIKRQAEEVERARTRMLELVQDLIDSGDRFGRFNVFPKEGSSHEAEPINDQAIMAQYEQARDAWKMANDILDQMTQEQERARVALLMPRRPATIHERATPVIISSSWSPDFALQFGLVVLGTLVGLLLGLGIAFFFGVRVMNRPDATR